ncbi:aldehyde/histidinol dehydrogenase [Nitzschia inconspicua]|uniref:Aldehyde/histidinol dehydrogenase n=1 Tax=Nitzschia inconspicua TaxID=303405 RepID=A0A9K3LQR0_9STRA|nr:aldehyde/histidinol dehydrogenase [Nitzschia inconspicua]
MSTAGECVAPGSSIALVARVLERVDPSVFVITSFLAVVVLTIMMVDKYHLLYHGKLWFEYLTTSVPTIEVPMTDAEAHDDGVKGEPVKTMQLVDPKDQTKLNCYDPSTKQLLGQAKNMSAKEVEKILLKAKKAQEEWKQTTFAQRRMVLRTIQKYVVNHVQDICRVSARESGKPKVDAVMGEILTTCEKIRTVCEWGELWLRPEQRPTGPMMMHKSAWVEYVPLGVIVAIAPWNYPFHNSINHVISGLMAGNAVVGKVSEHASWSADYFGRILHQALKVNGHNPDLVATVTGMAEAGVALCTSPLVDKIIFTGSTPIGRKVMESAAKNLTPLVLELGGKDVMVLRHDVKLSNVLPFVMRGCYQNSGQNCVGVERVLVYESIYDEFLKQIVPKAKALRQGNPLASCGADGKVDCGSMIMPAQLQIVQALVDDAVKKGATLHCGGKINPGLNGQFFEPTVLSGITPEMNIFNQEVFGPVMTVVKVPKDDDQECIRLVNQSAFGLGSSIFTADDAAGLKIGQQFRTGMLTVNDFGSNYLIQSLPFGGVKESGFGRFAGIEGLRALCLERAIVVDKVSLVRTAIPTPIDYPIDMNKGFPFTESLVQLFYNENLFCKIKGIFGLIKNG